MALSITPPSANNSNKDSEETVKPVNPNGAPALLEHKSGLPVVPPPHVGAVQSGDGRDLDEEDIFTSRTDVKTDTFEYVDRNLNLNEYEGIGKLSAEEVISNDYDRHYARLEEKVVEVKTWLQEILNEQNKTQDVADARREKGAKYQEVKTLLDQLLVRYFAQERIVRKEDATILSSLVINEILGLGPIEPLWQDPRITEIMVNGPYRTRVEINGRLVTAKGVRFRDQEHLLDTAQQILAPLNKTIDVAHTFEDGRLPDGSRINVTHPVIGPGGPYLTIRRFPEEVFTVRKLVDMGSMTEEMAEEIGNLIYHACSTSVSGGTGSGKTSMLNALSGCIPDDERIITIEDNLELRLHPSRDVVAMEARRSHQGDKNNVTIRDLVRNSLRQRPDRIVVGEVRDGAAYDMLQAMNTGHEGSMTTVHANDAYGAIDRLVNLISEIGELDSNQALSLIANGVDIIVSISRYEDGSRRVSTISEIPARVDAKDGRVSLEPIILWEFVQTGEDENNMIVGEYVRKNELSENFIKRHRLDKKPRLTIEELYKLSDHGQA